MDLGINTFFIDINESYNLGLKRIEIVSSSKEKTLSDAEKANIYSMKYSIHLPVFLPQWYNFGQWDVFFCDTNPQKRSLSFELLEENLEFIKDLNCEYAVLHFGGVVPSLSKEELENYPKIIEESLAKIETLSLKYNIRILLEYFGLNKNFYLPHDWLSTVSCNANIGLLVDTGHLYFSCIYNNLDLSQTLDELAYKASAFHIWNTKGRKHYSVYHHIAPNLSQKTEEGWAFSTLDLVQFLNLANPSAPIIIEPNVLFGGKDFILNSIRDVQKILENMK